MPTLQEYWTSITDWLRRQPSGGTSFLVHYHLIGSVQNNPPRTVALTWGYLDLSREGVTGTGINYLSPDAPLPYLGAQASLALSLSYAGWSDKPARVIRLAPAFQSQIEVLTAPMEVVATLSPGLPDPEPVLRIQLKYDGQEGLSGRTDGVDWQLVLMQRTQG